MRGKKGFLAVFMLLARNFAFFDIFILTQMVKAKTLQGNRTGRTLLRVGGRMLKTYTGLMITVRLDRS